MNHNNPKFSNRLTEKTADSRLLSRFRCVPTFCKENQLNEKTDRKKDQGEPVGPVNVQVLREVTAGARTDYDTKTECGLMNHHLGGAFSTAAGAVVQVRAVSKTKAAAHDDK